MSSENPQNRTDEHKAALVERILRGDITAEQACREQDLSDSELQEWVGAYRRTQRRLMEEQLSAALTARGLPAEDAPISEFSGSLDSLALAELIQTIEYGRKDAQIRVDHDGQQSHIWCEQGQVIDARSGPLTGSAAMYRLVSLRHGRVYARFVGAERGRTIHASTAALLLEAAKRYDECRQLRERIGDTSAVYVASPSAWAAEARLAPETWQMLRAFDGVSSVERVISTRTSPELETLTEVAALLEQGLLMDKPRASSPNWLPLSSEPADSSGASQISLEPLAASLRARLTQAGPLNRRLWLSAAAGASAVGAAFAVGFWSVQQGNDSPRPQLAVASARGGAALARSGECPPGSARIAAGPRSAEVQPETIAEGSPAALSPFCLGRWEVTVAEFEACVAANGCAPAGRESDVARQCNAGQLGRERHPINCVSLQQAQQYCAWRGGRLPSPAEWEYAARQVTPDAREAHPGTLPVGAFPAGANPEGVLDLLGNVSEWTSGELGPRSAADDDDARRQLYAVLGAGSQAGASRLGAHATRLYMNASVRSATVGFRCALDL